jgi:DNA-binding transcriptional ArsR family regulator
MNESDAVNALAALAQSARLRVFRALVGAGPQGMRPADLVALLDIPNSTLSFHLKELTQAGLVQVERDSRHLHYRPALDRMQALMGYLSDHCCQSGAAPAAGCAPMTVCEPGTACAPTRSTVSPSTPTRSTP